MAQPKDLENRFTFHPAQGDQGKIYEEIRAAGHDMAKLIDQFSPECREQSLAITKIEEAVFWANAAIARHT